VGDDPLIGVLLGDFAGYFCDRFGTDSFKIVVPVHFEDVANVVETISCQLVGIRVR
jgi:hypothetical protein